MSEITDNVAHIDFVCRILFLEGCIAATGCFNCGHGFFVNRLIQLQYWIVKGSWERLIRVKYGMGLNALSVFELLVVFCIVSYGLHLVKDGVLDFFRKGGIVFESVIHLVVTRGSLTEFLVQNWIIEVIHNRL